MSLGDLECFKIVAAKLGYDYSKEDNKIQQKKLNDSIGTDQTVLNKYRRTIRTESKISLEGFLDICSK